MEIRQKHKKIDVLFDTTTLLLHMYICIYKKKWNQHTKRYIFNSQVYNNTVYSIRYRIILNKQQ